MPQHINDMEPQRQNSDLRDDELLSPSRIELFRDTRHLLGGGSFGKVYIGLLDGVEVAIKVTFDKISTKISNPDENEQEGEEEDDHAKLTHPLIQLKRELRRYRRFRNQYIVQFLGGCQDEENPDRIMLVTELMKGGSLGDVLQKIREKRKRGWEMTMLSSRKQVAERKERERENIVVHMTMQTIITLALHIVRGLQYLHAERVTHGDLKPGNILLSAPFSLLDPQDSPGEYIYWSKLLTSSASQFFASMPKSNTTNPLQPAEIHAELYQFPQLAFAKLTDFGLSRRQALLDTNISDPKRDVQVGTLAYLAPELYTDNIPDHEHAEKADIYALSLIFYELLSLMRPWEGFSPNKLYAVLIGADERPKWPDWCNILREQDMTVSMYMDLVETCWRRESMARPSARDISSMLRGLLEHHMNEAVNAELANESEEDEGHAGKLGGGNNNDGDMGSSAPSLLLKLQEAVIGDSGVPAKAPDAKQQQQQQQTLAPGPPAVTPPQSWPANAAPSAANPPLEPAVSQSMHVSNFSLVMPPGANQQQQQQDHVSVSLPAIPVDPTMEPSQTPYAGIWTSPPVNNAEGGDQAAIWQIGDSLPAVQSHKVWFQNDEPLAEPNSVMATPNRDPEAEKKHQMKLMMSSAAALNMVSEEDIDAEIDHLRRHGESNNTMLYMSPGQVLIRHGQSDAHPAAMVSIPQNTGDPTASPVSAGTGSPYMPRNPSFLSSGSNAESNWLASVNGFDNSLKLLASKPSSAIAAQARSSYMDCSLKLLDYLSNIQTPLDRLKKYTSIHDIIVANVDKVSSDEAMFCAMLRLIEVAFGTELAKLAVSSTELPVRDPSLNGIANLSMIVPVCSSVLSKFPDSYNLCSHVCSVMVAASRYCTSSAKALQTSSSVERVLEAGIVLRQKSNKQNEQVSLVTSAHVIYALGCMISALKSVGALNSVMKNGHARIKSSLIILTGDFTISELQRVAIGSMPLLEASGISTLSTISYTLYTEGKARAFRRIEELPDVHNMCSLVVKEMRAYSGVGAVQTDACLFLMSLCSPNYVTPPQQGPTHGALHRVTSMKTDEEDFAYIRMRIVNNGGVEALTTLLVEYGLRSKSDIDKSVCELSLSTLRLLMQSRDGRVRAAGCHLTKCLLDIYPRLQEDPGVLETCSAVYLGLLRDADPGKHGCLDANELDGLLTRAKSTLEGMARVISPSSVPMTAAAYRETLALKERRRTGVGFNPK